MSKIVRLLLGTTKGAFLLTGTPDRAGWTLSGPHCGGWKINHMTADPETGTLFAGGGDEWTGAGVWRSGDGGETWTLSKLSKGQVDDWAANDPAFAEMIGWTPAEPAFGDTLSSVWSLHAAHGKVHAGTKPAQFLTSGDGGETWAMGEALAEFPDRDTWNGGAAGLVLHSILSDPGDAKKIWVGISAAGVFATEDGGATWERRNRMSNAEACVHHDHPAAPRNGETGHCVHNMMRAPGSGDLLYQQNHHGVYRSVDGGRNWDDVTEGLPSTFGFPIRVHPRDPETIWTLPLNGDTAGRYPPDAKAAVWKSIDGGRTWADKRTGLPGENCFFTVLRQGMSGDTREPAGLYFGTNSGSVFASRDEGETWHEIARHLPCILSVDVAEVPA